LNGFVFGSAPKAPNRKQSHHNKDVQQNKKDRKLLNPEKFNIIAANNHPDGQIKI